MCESVQVPPSKVDDFVTPVRGGTQFSELLCEGENNVMALNFIRESPCANDLTTALSRSLS